MNKEKMKQAVDFLKTTEIKQNTIGTSLFYKDGSVCVLGAMCIGYGYTPVFSDYVYTDYCIKGKEEIITGYDAVRNELGLPYLPDGRQFVSNIWKLNDSKKLTFKEIAKELESEYLK